MIFTGSAWGLFGNWIKWLLLCVITLGIYMLWVGPRIARWKWENTDFDSTWSPNSVLGATTGASALRQSPATSGQPQLPGGDLVGTPIVTD
jgi:hypothetical protein